jgi:hypothetical protein
MSAQRQEELTTMLDRVLALPAVVSLHPDSRTRRVHYDWLEAGEHTQRTVAQLSQQLRRFLDDQAWLENRRIMEILHAIEGHALELRQSPPPGSLMSIVDLAADIELPMERPLYSPAFKPQIVARIADADAADVDAGALFSQFVIDKAQLAGLIRRFLQERGQATLRELCQAHPLEKGLAELVAYLQLADASFQATVDETVIDDIAWTSSLDGETKIRKAHLPRVIYVRKG